ncbi:hypothetical protein Taro_032227 [Colocasia esculenta]|uniref:Uncharacterized protein n=1 Tax=Colocasia esculenta TaxID=4460 RepID=A0A843VWQ7_COLES|nr:hypothetical protein [Colocasia esculenta]
MSLTPAFDPMERIQNSQILDTTFHQTQLNPNKLNHMQCKFAFEKMNNKNEQKKIDSNKPNSEKTEAAKEKVSGTTQAGQEQTQEKEQAEGLLSEKTQEKAVGTTQAAKKKAAETTQAAKKKEYKAEEAAQETAQAGKENTVMRSAAQGAMEALKRTVGMGGTSTEGKEAEEECRDQ